LATGWIAQGESLGQFDHRAAGAVGVGFLEDIAAQALRAEGQVEVGFHALGEA
jgi:hypothetical protein